MKLSTSTVAIPKTMRRRRYRLLLFRTFLTGPREDLVAHGSQSGVSSSVRHRAPHAACRVSQPAPRAGFRSDRSRQATRCICPAARGLSTAVRRSCDQAPSRHPASRAAPAQPAPAGPYLESLAWSRTPLPNPGLPLRRNAHFPAIGQASHNGDFAVHTVAPSSMTAWFHTTDGRSETTAFRGIIVRQQPFRQRVPRDLRCRRAIRRRRTHVTAPADVRVDHRDPFAESERQHRACRVITDAGQSKQFVVRMRQLVGVIVCDDVRAFLQSQGRAADSQAAPMR